MDNLKIVKSLKLSFDQLGYAVVDGKITKDRNVYRCYLRSGKVDKVKMTTSDRSFQLNTSYTNYFKNKLSKNNPSNKQMIHYALKKDQDFKPNRYYKAIIQVTNKLLNLGYLKITTLPDGKLLRDTYNNLDFYYSNSTCEVYRLINGKSILYKL